MYVQVVRTLPYVPYRIHSVNFWVLAQEPIYERTLVLYCLYRQSAISRILINLYHRVLGITTLDYTDPNTTVTATQQALVLLGLLVSMSRFLLAKDLTSLSHICYVGFVSIVVLCVTMA